MITMLWDMIRYKNFDSNSPYNREAAAWTQSQTDFAFPIDTRSIRDRVSCQTNENVPRKPTKTNKPIKARKESPWGILSRLVSTEPPLPTQPAATSPTQPTATIVTDTSDTETPPADGVQVDDGIQIIEATIVEPTATPESTATPPTSHHSTDEGILFLN